MQEIKLDVQIRKEIGSSKSRAARRNNYIPGVVYGGSKDATSIKVDRKVFDRSNRAHRGETLIFHLNVLEDEKKVRDYSANTKELQENTRS